VVAEMGLACNRDGYASGITSVVVGSAELE